MAGPYRNRHSGIYYFRKATPTHLKSQKQKLIELGVKYQGMVEWSLNTRDPKQAERLYPLKKAEAESMWNCWESMLINGPTELNHKQIITHAGHAALRLLAHFEDEPSNLPRPELKLFDFGLRYSLALSQVPELHMGDQVDDLLEEINKIPSPKVMQFLQDELERAASSSRTVLLEAARAVMAIHLSKLTLKEIEKELHRYATQVDAPTSIRLQEQARQYGLRLIKTLNDRQDGDYREAEWISGLPGKEAVQGDPTPLSFNAVIELEIEQRLKGLGGNKLAKNSIAKYLRIAGKYARHSGSDDVRKVSKENAISWRDAMMDVPGLKNRTIADRLTALGTIVNYARTQPHLPSVFSTENPLKGLRIPHFEKPSKGSRTHSLEEAKQILAASRSETRIDRRWLPWLCAYSGARVEELAKLRKSNFRLVEGVLCFDIKNDPGQNQRTKNRSSIRTIPVHSALISEGIESFLEGFDHSEPLFPINASKNVGRWIKLSVLNSENSKPPNHAWRHLFKDLCNRYDVSVDTRIAINGYSTNDQRDGSENYGGSDAALIGHKRELEKIPPFLD